MPPKQQKNISKVIIIIFLLSLLSPLIGLTIYAEYDPQEQWIKIYDGTRTDKAYAVTTDSDNNVIVTGLSQIDVDDTAYAIKYTQDGTKILDIIPNTTYECIGYDVTVTNTSQIPGGPTGSGALDWGGSTRRSLA